MRSSRLNFIITHHSWISFHSIARPPKRQLLSEWKSIFTHIIYIYIDIICISNLTAPQNGHPTVNDTMPKPGSSSCARNDCWKPPFCGFPDFGVMGRVVGWATPKKWPRSNMLIENSGCHQDFRSGLIFEELHPSAEWISTISSTIYRRCLTVSEPKLQNTPLSLWWTSITTNFRNRSKWSEFERCSATSRQ